MTKEPMRIQKWISQLGLASRREVEKLIEEKRISINGETLTEFGRKIDPEKDIVTIDGKPIVPEAPPRVYWLLHKPKGCLTARKAQGDRRTIYDLPSLKNTPFHVAAVGRLDFDTEGLLLLSNDGDLVFRLAHPKYKMPRAYQVLIDRRLTREEEAEIKKGLTLKDGPVKKVQLQYAQSQNLGKSRGYWYFITVHEGRNRLVRRIFEHFECRVIRLIRHSFGDLRLDDELKPGNYRQLTSEEITILKKATGLA